ncbi:MAG TPA: Crp/Fnr family transcriptional regulator [Frankiaceae bacterium]|nr:Crp/Fnr family transcriptional regulator [Frankiaceae bacterium]
MPEEFSPERWAPRRRGLARDPFLAVVAVMLGGEALAPVRTRLIKPGDVLAEPGEPLRYVYAVLSGRLGLLQRGPGAGSGRPRLREVLGAGQRAGEVHLLSDRRAPSDFRLQCLTSGLVAVIDADLYGSWCRRPEVVLPALRELTEQARARERLRLSWLELDVTARLAALLLDLHERFGDGLTEGLSQTQLGDLIGARRETVNRAGRKLLAEGLIHDGPRGIELRDVQGLAARAGRSVGAELQEERAVS